MRLPKFAFVEPTTVKEASSVLRENPEAKVLAGGTDLLVNMKHRIEIPPMLVNLKRISGLDFIQENDGFIRIGAMASLKSIYENPLIAKRVPALAKAASSVGSYHHQTMGTIGGNLLQQNRCKFFNQSRWWRSSRKPCFKVGGEVCHVVTTGSKCYSSYCGDLAPALMVLDAQVKIESAGGARELPLEDLFSGDGRHPLSLKAGDILTEIIIPDESCRGASTYVKFARRESIDFPIVGVAAYRSDKKKEFRVSFTAVDRSPVRAAAVENFLKGKDLDEKVMEEAANLASKAATPVKTSVYSPSYKRQMMGVLLKVAMKEVGK